MRRSIAIALFIICFGAVVQILNGSGAFGYALPGAAISNVDVATLTDLTENVINAETNPVGGILTNLPALGYTLLKVLVGALTISPIMLDFGIPLWISVPLNIPIWIIYLWDLYLLRKNSVPD